VPADVDGDTAEQTEAAPGFGPLGHAPYTEGLMKSLCTRLFLAVSLVALGVVGCESDNPTSADLAVSEAPPAGSLLSFGEVAPEGGVTLIRVRDGERLTTGDATLSFLESALSFTAEVTKEVDGQGYVSFKFGPSGLGFSPAAVLAISIDKADLTGIDPDKLRIAAASDDLDDWSVVGGIYDPVTRTVIAPVTHFSRYALCVDD
jgi:hypothetical protein